MKIIDYLLLAFLLLLLVIGICTIKDGGISPVSIEPIPEDSRSSVEIPIIMYHGITQNPSKEKEYFISKDRFERDLKWVQKEGYTTIFPSQLIDYVYNGTSLPEKPIILSFDDGYCNNYINAFPLLQEYNMKATIAIIGIESEISSNDVYRVPASCSLSWGEIAILARSGLVEFSNHSYDLHETNRGRKGADIKPGESLENYRQVLTKDLIKNQSLIELATGRTPKVFVWPFGAYPLDGSAEPILKDLGFKASFNSYQRTSIVERGNTDSLFGLGRYLRNPKFSMETINNPKH